ncbi:MAG: Hemerythrin cation binding domain protein [Deltaproteobacteria bacterium]|nr:Hemerythrin cation binding domain protein [Deltaproteobacteria bacterium]
MVNIGERPASGFDDPMGLLGDCHRRLERFLNLLMTVTEQAHGGAMTAEQRDALEVSLRYFREAAPKHTSDEEESLFPRLRSVGDPRVKAVLDRVHTLEADHRAAVVDHAEVERLARRWLRDGRLAAGETRELAARLHELHALYRHHIAIEDDEIFPLARELLRPGDLAQIGEEMARRRGLGRQAAQIPK